MYHPILPPPKYKTDAAYDIAKFFHDVWAPLFAKYWATTYSLEDFYLGNYIFFFEGDFFIIRFFPAWLPSDVSLQFAWHTKKNTLQVLGELGDVLEAENSSELELDFSPYEEKEYELFLKVLNSKKGKSFLKNALTLFTRFLSLVVSILTRLMGLPLPYEVNGCLFTLKESLKTD